MQTHCGAKRAPSTREHRPHLEYPEKEAGGQAAHTTVAYSKQGAGDATSYYDDPGFENLRTSGKGIRLVCKQETEPWVMVTGKRRSPALHHSQETVATAKGPVTKTPAETVTVIPKMFPAHTQGLGRVSKLSTCGHFQLSTHGQVDGSLGSI